MISTPSIYLSIYLSIDPSFVAALIQPARSMLVASKSFACFFDRFFESYLHKGSPGQLGGRPGEAPREPQGCPRKPPEGLGRPPGEGSGGCRKTPGAPEGFGRGDPPGDSQKVEDWVRQLISLEQVMLSQSHQKAED